MSWFRRPLPPRHTVDEKWTDEDCFNWVCDTADIQDRPALGPNTYFPTIVRALHVVCQRVREMEKKS